METANKKNSALLLQVCAASVVYLILCCYLFYPYVSSFHFEDYLVFLNILGGGIGCFLLSRRWIFTPIASIMCGAVYVFSPLYLTLSALHPFAGFTGLLIPWLMLPATYLPLKIHKPAQKQIFTCILCALPFVLIGCLYWLISRPETLSFYPVPDTMKIERSELSGLLFLHSIKAESAYICFYHIALIAGIAGMTVYLKTRKHMLVILIAVGLAASMITGPWNIPPIIWAFFAMLNCCIIIGMGFQFFAWSGQSDSKLSGICIAVALCLTGLAFYLSIDKPALFKNAYEFYFLAVVLYSSLFFLCRSNVRWHPFRWVLLISGFGLDIVLNARYVIDALH